MNARDREMHQRFERAGYAVVAVEHGKKHYRVKLRCADGFEFFVPQSLGSSNGRVKSHFFDCAVTQARNIERQQREKRHA